MGCCGWQLVTSTCLYNFVHNQTFSEYRVFLNKWLHRYNICGKYSIRRYHPKMEPNQTSCSIFSISCILTLTSQLLQIPSQTVAKPNIFFLVNLQQMVQEGCYVLFQCWNEEGGLTSYGLWLPSSVTVLDTVVYSRIFKVVVSILWNCESVQVKPYQGIPEASTCTRSSKYCKTNWCIPAY